MNPILQYITDLEAHGFKPNHTTRDGACTTQDIINFCNKKHEKGIILFCDQTKAFDRVNWDYLKKR